MFGAIKTLFTKAVELTSTLFQSSEIVEEGNDDPVNGFLQPEVIDDEPKIKKLKRSKQNYDI
jgi:hypothetical protein